MNQESRIEKKLKAYYQERRRLFSANEAFDQQVLEQAGHIPPQRLNQTRTWKDIGSILMTYRLGTLTTLGALALLVFALTWMDHTTPKAYGIEQTLEAIKQVQTVHMRGEFYLQGTFECWMRFNGNPDRPTHLWLGLPDKPLCKICSPEGVFGLNRRTGAVHYARRDERNKPWIIKFSNFFTKILEDADKNDWITIYTETDPHTQTDSIVVHIDAPKREQRFLVDPRTKLPLSLQTLRDDDPQEMMRRTLWIKNIEWIVYNAEPPAGIFAMPENAYVVDEEVDTMVDPDSGLMVDGMSPEQACMAIVQKAGRAMVDLDRETLTSLALFFRLFHEDIWTQVEQMKQAGQWVTALTITGAPYQEGDLWYVPAQIEYGAGQTETNTPMIKFYDMEGHRYAFIIGSKEKGVVD